MVRPSKTSGHPEPAEGRNPLIRNPQSTIRNSCSHSFKSRAQFLLRLTKTESQIPVHAEMIARHDENAFFEPQPCDEFCRIDRMTIADVHHRPGVRRHVAEEIAGLVKPISHDRKVAIQHTARPRK